MLDQTCSCHLNKQKKMCRRENQKTFKKLDVNSLRIRNEDEGNKEE